ncbi:MAG: hypothetical protein H6834_09995 [Planctomycetes bacterium]|nr:hypothetical protein [Planctomycetota bacterium]
MNTLMKTMALGLLLVSGLPRDVHAQTGPDRGHLSRLDYYLRDFEDRVKRGKGSQLSLGVRDKEMLTELRNQVQKFPDDEQVRSMFERAKTAYNASKGHRFQITPEMLAFRDKGARKVQAAARFSVDAWQKLQAELAADPNYVAKAFPAPDPMTTPLDQMEGKRVVLEGIRHEELLFKQNGMQWIPAGAPSRGYYYIQGAGRGYAALFEAVRRYQTQFSGEYPPEWTVVGVVRDVQLLVPEVGKEKVGSAYLGWEVEPQAVWVDGKVLALRDEQHQEGAKFAGEDQLETILSDLHSIKSVPENVDPAGLIDVLVVAMKEKNYDLYLQCIHPDEQQTAIQRANLQMYWNASQKGLENVHVHAHPHKVGEIQTIKGGGPDADLDEFFGDGVETKSVGPLIERVSVEVRVYNEAGLQSALPRFVVMERRNKGRWYLISNFSVLM